MSIDRILIFEFLLAYFRIEDTLTFAHFEIMCIRYMCTSSNIDVV